MIENLRSISGYKSIDGRIINDNIFRSNNLKNIDDSVLNYLRDIDLVVDLRTVDEVNDKESSFKKYFNYINIDLGHRYCPSIESMIPVGYFEIINDKDSIRKIIDLLINYDRLFFHCSMGKDRTGCVIMIIMLILGISDDDIINDDSVSYDYMIDDINLYHELNPNAPSFAGCSKKEYMRHLLDLFYDKFHNIENYFDYLNIDR